MTDHSPHGKSDLRELGPLNRSLRQAIPEVYPTSGAPATPRPSPTTAAAS